MARECTGSHRFFVSEPKTTDSNEAWVILICTACGEARRIIVPLDPSKPIKQ